MHPGTKDDSAHLPSLAPNPTAATFEEADRRTPTLLTLTAQTYFCEQIRDMELAHPPSSTKHVVRSHSVLQKLSPAV